MWLAAAASKRKKAGKVVTEYVKKMKAAVEEAGK